MPAKFFLPDARLQSTLTQILEETWEAFEQLAQNQIAVTWIVYEPPYRINTGGALSAEEFWKYQPKGASYRGVELIDPAGMVTLFYMVAMHVWLEQGMVQPTPEIDRALTDMIAVGSQSATSYIVDVLSGTTSGPELPPGPNETWQYQRNIVNRYFHQLGWPELRGVNMNQKLWLGGAYGRENTFLGKALEHKNMLTTEAIARLLHSIVGGVSVSSERSQVMMARLQQMPRLPQNTAAEARVWSKATADKNSQHSATYVEAEGAHPYQLVIFTANEQGQSEAIATFISDRILAAAKQSFALTDTD